MRAAALALVLWPALLAAHTTPSERRVMVQVDEQGVALALELSVRGREAALLLAQLDVDRDGRLSQGEATAVARLLTQKGLAGLRLRWDEAPLAVTAVDARLTSQGPVLTALALVQLDAPPAGGGLHDLSIELEGGYGGALVQAQALGAFRVFAAGSHALARDRRGLLRPAELAGGGALALRVGPVEAHGHGPDPRR